MFILNTILIHIRLFELTYLLTSYLYCMWNRFTLSADPSRLLLKQQRLDRCFGDLGSKFDLLPQPEFCTSLQTHDTTAPRAQSLRIVVELTLGRRLQFLELLQVLPAHPGEPM